jgi:secondary thiamine-phosphate synthase enzyme
MWIQKKLMLSAKPRGFHLVTAEITQQLPEIGQFSLGILNLFIQHTSASLTINENADETVRKDMESHINQMIPENMEYYLHNYEGDDDMPAHIKSSLLGSSVSIPITDGRLAFGTWQGIYLGEHRVSGGKRKILATINGKE